MSDVVLPPEWELKIKGRKILAFGLNASFLLLYNEKILAKIRFALEQMKQASGSMICLFSPDACVDRIEELDPGIWAKYSELVQGFGCDADIIYDAGHMAGSYVERIAGYYGGPSDLAGVCHGAGKPVMFMDVDLLE